jgi:hypothetical protein
MEYPHRRYLMYLLSKRFTSYEIAASCTARYLMVPTEDSLQALSAELGDPPNSWEPHYNYKNVTFRRWLRDRGLHDAWKNAPQVRMADKFLHAGTVRKDFEALVAVHGVVERARTELLLKHPEKLVPSIPNLETFYYLYWNLGEMSQGGLWDFMEANEERKELLPALAGEIATTYGMLGLRQRVDEMELIDNFIAFTNQQVQATRRSGGECSGQRAIGLAALFRQAAVAAERREEISQEVESTTMRKDAQAFKLRMVKRAGAIPSLDELEEGPIDIDFKEVDNVRKFPSR